MVRDDSERRAILTRRARFLAGALASAGLVVTATSCGGEGERDSGSASGGAGGSGSSGGTSGTGGAGGSGGSAGTPQPCLIAPNGGGTGGVDDDAGDAQPDADDATADAGASGD